MTEVATDMTHSNVVLLFANKSCWVLLCRRFLPFLPKRPLISFSQNLSGLKKRRAFFWFCLPPCGQTNMFQTLMNISSGSMWNIVLILSIVVVVESLLLLACVFVQCSGLIRIVVKYTAIMLIVPGVVWGVVFYYHKPLKDLLPETVLLTEDGPERGKPNVPSSGSFRYTPRPRVPLPPPLHEELSVWRWIMPSLWNTETNNAYTDENGCRKETDSFLDENGDTIHTTRIKC